MSWIIQCKSINLSRKHEKDSWHQDSPLCVRDATCHLLGKVHWWWGWMQWEEILQISTAEFHFHYLLNIWPNRTRYRKLAEPLLKPLFISMCLPVEERQWFSDTKIMENSGSGVTLTNYQYNNLLMTQSFPPSLMPYTHTLVKFILWQSDSSGRKQKHLSHRSTLHLSYWHHILSKTFGMQRYLRCCCCSSKNQEQTYLFIYFGSKAFTKEWDKSTIWIHHQIKNT